MPPFFGVETLLLLFPPPAHQRAARSTAATTTTATTTVFWFANNRRAVAFTALHNDGRTTNDPYDDATSNRTDLIRLNATRPDPTRT